MAGIFAFFSRRAVAGLVLAAGGAGAFSAWQLQSGTAAKTALDLVAAQRGDVVVSVGGVGRIVEANATGSIHLPVVSGSAGGAPATGPTVAPAGSVFAQSPGHISRFLVQPGQHVAARQPVAVVDDGGAAHLAVVVATTDLETALLELRQKQSSDPQKGIPATPAELAAGQLAVLSAERRLAQLRGPARAADVTAAKLELKRAQADRAALMRPPSTPSPQSLSSAREALAAARARLTRLFHPQSADLAAARADLARARADQAALRASTSSPEAIAAAREALTAAQRRLDKVQGPANPADLAAADAEVGKARADLVALQQAATTIPDALAATREALTAAQAKLDKVQGPASPADLAAAEAELRKAQSDLAILQADPTIVPAAALAAALTTAQAAVTAAQLKLNRLQGPADAADLAAARSDMKKAEADVATAQRNPTTPEAVTAAQQVLTAAQQRLAKLQGPADPADVATARSDVRKAEADLAAALKGPTPEALAAAAQAVTAAQRKLMRLQAKPGPADLALARADVQKAAADLAALRAPTHETIAAAGAAVVAARAKLAQVLGPPRTADVTAAKLDVLKAKADLAVLRARGGPASPTDLAVARLKADVAQQRLDAARNAERLLTVRAASSGTVTALDTVPGAPVDLSTPIATIADLDHLAVSVDLSEFDVAQVKRDMNAVVRVDALGGKAFRGKVLFVPFSGSDNGGVVTFPVRVGLTHAAGLKPGMNVSVRVIVAQRLGVVEVPVEAVARDDEDRAIVSVALKNGKVVERKVKTGLANNKSIEIVSGLRPGEQIVLAAAGEEA